MHKRNQAKGNREEENPALALSHNRHNTKVYSISFRKPSYVCPHVICNAVAPRQIENYKKWLDKHIYVNSVTNIDELNTANVYNVTYLLKCIWGDTLTDLSGIMKEFSKPFPQDSSGFHDYLSFLQMVAWNYEMMPGWLDCDLNVDSGETSRDDSIYKFGNSVIRANLMETLY